MKQKRFKKHHKMASLLLCIIIMCTFLTISASAAVIDDSVNTPNWIASCPNGEKHQMIPSGSAIVCTGTYNNPGTSLHNGHINICSNCSEVLWSLHQPNLTYTLGKYYITSLAGLSTDPNMGRVIFIGNASNLSEFNGSVLRDSYWQGYEFLLPY